jgi:hypothetical protein
VRKIRWLAELGAPTIHLSIGAEPLSVEASRICVLVGLDVIAQHTVGALTAAHPRRPAGVAKCRGGLPSPGSGR